MSTDNNTRQGVITMNLVEQQAMEQDKAVAAAQRKLETAQNYYLEAVEDDELEWAANLVAKAQRELTAAVDTRAAMDVETPNTHVQNKMY